MSKNDCYSFAMKLIIFWQAFPYKYCTVLSIIQLAGEIKTVHCESFNEYLEEKSRQDWTQLDIRQVCNFLHIELREFIKIYWKTFLKHYFAVGNMPVNQSSHEKDSKAFILWIKVGKEVEFAKYAAITNVLNILPVKYC